MPKLTSTLLFIANAGVVSSGRMARKTQLKSSEAVDCSQLSNLSFNGTDFSSTAMLVCQFWPGGGFPVTDVNKVSDVLGKAMGPGGAWDEIQKLKDTKGGNRGFCWRKDAMREVSKTRCDIESRGQCYGDCPYGYSPKLLTGSFSPVCNSACSDGALPVACGMGCARGIGSCAGALIQQIGSVTSAVAEVYELMGGDAEPLKQVNRIVVLTEFAISTVGTLWGTLRSIAESSDSDEFSVEAIILLFQAVKEAAPGLKEDLDTLKGAMKEIMSLFVSLMDTHSSGGVDLDSLKNVLLDQSDEVLDAAVNVVKAFTYARCEPAVDVAFTLDKMGDDRLMGPWVQRDTMHGHPKYTIRGERASILEWSSKRDRWEIFVDEWCGVVCLGGRKVMYVNYAQTYDFPTEGWEVEKGLAPAPLVIAMREPLVQ